MGTENKQEFIIGIKILKPNMFAISNFFFFISSLMHTTFGFNYKLYSTNPEEYKETV